MGRLHIQGVFVLFFCGEVEFVSLNAKQVDDSPGTADLTSNIHFRCLRSAECEV